MKFKQIAFISIFIGIFTLIFYLGFLALTVFVIVKVLLWTCGIL